MISIKQIKYELIQAAFNLRQINPQQILDLSDITRLSQEENIQSTVNQNLQKHYNSSLQKILQDDQIKLQLYPEQNNLKSYQRRKNFQIDQKNILKLEFSKQILNPVDPQALLITFAIFHPVVNKKKTQQVILLDNMLVKEFLDSIHCLADLIPLGTLDTSKTFHMGSLQIKPNTRIDSLMINSEFYYTHRENCRHLIRIVDLHLLNSGDCQQRVAYPLTSFLPQTKKRKCEICVGAFAKFVCVNDQSISKPVCYMCSLCYQGIHYQNGQAPYTFKAYPYFND